MKGRRALLGVALAGLLCTCGEAVLGASARAQEDVAERMAEAFKKWGADNGFARANIAIVQNGRVIKQASYGRTSDAVRHPIASVSKSITGLCVAKLVEAGRLRYDARIGDVLPQLLPGNQRPRDGRLLSITVEQLLTQTSGMVDDMGKGAEPYASLWALARLAATRPLGANPGEKFSYTNLNYVFLDAIIETVTGESYDAACRRLVLAPVGAEGARLYYDGLRPRPTWVDWQLSAAEYGRVMRYFDKSSGLLAAGVEQWPKFALSKSSAYSLGVSLHLAPNLVTFLHNGAFLWNWNGKTDSYGAFFVYWYTGLGYFVSFAPDNGKARDELERKLWTVSQATLKPSVLGAESEPSTNRAGSDYRSPNVRGGNAEQCLSACKAEDRCRAYTYVAPGSQGPDARCYLKSEVPQPRADDCCTSGVVR
jgi:CubicO group peptidase (beta-lactamase class C family)